MMIIKLIRNILNKIQTESVSIPIIKIIIIKKQEKVAVNTLIKQQEHYIKTRLVHYFVSIVIPILN